MELHMQIQVNTTNMWEIELLALYVKKKKKLIMWGKNWKNKHCEKCMKYYVSKNLKSDMFTSP